MLSKKIMKSKAIHIFLLFMEKLSRNHSLKYNISSSNNISTINEAPLDSRDFLK